MESHLHYGSIVPVAGLETLVSLGTKRVSFEVQSRPREDGQEQRNKFKKKGEKRYGYADDNSFDKKGIHKGQAEEPVEMRRQDGSCAHKMADEPTKVTYSSPQDARKTTLHTRKANGVGGLVPRWLVPWLWFWVWSGSLGTVSGNSTTCTLAELKPCLNGSLSDGSLTAAMVTWRPDLLACSAESSCIACAASNGILTGAEVSWELFVPCINWTPVETVLGLALCLFVSLVTTCWLGMCFWFQKKLGNVAGRNTNGITETKRSFVL